MRYARDVALALMLIGCPKHAISEGSISLLEVQAKRGLAHWRCAVLLEISESDSVRAEEHFSTGFEVLEPIAQSLSHNEFSEDELAQIPYILLRPKWRKDDPRFQLGLAFRDVEKYVDEEIAEKLSGFSPKASNALKVFSAMNIYDESNCLLLQP